MIDLTTVMLDKNNEPIKQNYKTQVIEKDKVKEKNDFRETTLKDVCRFALLNTNEEALTPEMAIKRVNLYRKIQGESTIEISSDEKDLLAHQICKHFDTIIAGQAINLINQ